MGAGHDHGISEIKHEKPLWWAFGWRVFAEVVHSDPRRAIYLGDIPGVDVVGANAASIALGLDNSNALGHATTRTVTAVILVRSGERATWTRRWTPSSKAPPRNPAAACWSTWPPRPMHRW